ncbi:MAG: homocysteine biosynthesis protein [Clostridia bacterium]|nr:homocysteine biosynthesis protein [Clostridia bacterium]
MKVERTYDEINAKVRQGKVVVVTAEELVERAQTESLTSLFREIDVVTTGTFGAMCSSGVFLNLGHTVPRMKIQKAWLNDVPCYCGLAAVDVYLGATELPEKDPLNSTHPGEFRYGGGHVIEDLVARKPVHLRAVAYGTDCYPRRELDATITLDDLNDAILFNPRNAYQNYNCAVNTTSRTIYTYMGVLKPRLGNAHYSTSGQLSPLLKDPYFRTIGIGTRIFLGGGIGYVAGPGTQHFPSLPDNPDDKARVPSGGTLAVTGDLKQMQPGWLRGASFLGYGATLMVGIGIPIPILSEEVLYYASRSDAELFAPIVDYGDAYPYGEPGNLGYVSYAQLKSGYIEVQGQRVPTAPLSSYSKAREIAQILKSWIREGQFTLSEPVQLLPSVDAQRQPHILRDKPQGNPVGEGR